MKPRRTLTVLVGGLAPGLGVGQATGYPVTWDFAGEVTNVFDENDLLGGAVTVGTPFSGSFTFESTTPDADPRDPTFGSYPDAVVSALGQVGGFEFSGPIEGENFISVLEDLLGADSYGTMVGVELLGHPSVLRLILVDSSATMFSSDSLPPFPPDLGTLGTARYSVFSESDPFPFSVGGDIMFLVPDPGTFSLIAIGMLGIGRRRSARRRPTDLCAEV